MPSIWVNPKHRDKILAELNRLAAERDLIAKQLATEFALATEYFTKYVKVNRENERLHKLIDAQQALLDQMSRDLELHRGKSERERDNILNDDADEWSTVSMEAPIETWPLPAEDDPTDGA